MTDSPRLHVLVAVVAILLSACSGGSTPAATAPSSSPIVNAAIVQADVPAQPAFTNQLCSAPAVQVQPSGGFFFIGTRSFDIVITTGRPVDISGLTVELIDGSHVGGPSVTFPQATLSAQFGSTHFGPGTRTFRVNPQFGCGTRSMTRVGANITVTDMTGMRQTVSVSAPLN